MADESAAPRGADIDPDRYYVPTVTGRFRFAGVGFGPSSRTEVTGKLLRDLLASEHAPKVTGYAPA